MDFHVIFSLGLFEQTMLKMFITDYGHRLSALEIKMSQLSDAIAALVTSSQAEDTSLTAALARVQADVAAAKQRDIDMQAKIDALQAQVDAGGATPAEIQALADLKTQKDANKAILDAIDPSNPAVLTPALAAAVKQMKR